MWIPRTPMRPDFCGCPPCPLCFDWAGGEGEKAMRGIDKFTLDMVGREPTVREKRALSEAAEKIHAGNLARAKEREEKIEAFKAADEERAMQMQLRALAKEQRLAAKRPKKEPRPVTLDDLTPQQLEARSRPPVLETYAFNVNAFNEVLWDGAIKSDAIALREYERMRELKRREVERALYVGPIPRR